MINHCTLVRTVISLCFAISLTGTLSVLGQQPTASDAGTAAVKMLEGGDVTGAIAALSQIVKKNKKDAIGWHYLGVAFERAGKVKDASSAHERSAKAYEILLQNIDLPPDPAGFQYPQHADAELALNSANRYLALNPKLSAEDKALWQIRVFMLQTFATGPLPIPAGVIAPGNATTKPVIIRKPNPQYTETARRNGTTGMVQLQVIMGSDGILRVLRIIKSLPDGLTQRAILAAALIEFKPATKDGVPVSVLSWVEYSFNIH